MLVLSRFENLTPFSESWYDPLNVNESYSSLMDHRPYAQLVRGLNNIENQIGLETLPSTSLFISQVNNTLTEPLDSTSWSNIDFRDIAENKLSEGQYLNSHRKILLDVYDKLKDIATVANFGGMGEPYYINGVAGWRGLSDDYIRRVAPPIDSTSTMLSFFYNSATTWEVEHTGGYTGDFIDLNKFNYRQYWGKIIKTLQECIDNCNRVFILPYAQRNLVINIPYINNSTMFNGDIFWMNQRTDHVFSYDDVSSGSTCGTNYFYEIYDATSPSYYWPGITDFNECSSFKTSYNDSEFKGLDSTSEILTTLIGGDYRNTETSLSFWCRSLFAWSGSDENPYSPTQKLARVYQFLDRYNCSTGTPTPPDECSNFTSDYVNWLGQPRTAYLYNFGWCGLTSTEKKYNFSMGVSGTLPGGPSAYWEFENPPNVQVFAEWNKFPLDYNISVSWTNNSFVYSNKNQTEEITLKVDALPDYYLGQEILPVNRFQRIGGGVKKSRFLYYINGKLIGGPTPIYVFISPGNKFYVVPANEVE